MVTISAICKPSRFIHLSIPLQMVHLASSFCVPAYHEHDNLLRRSSCFCFSCMKRIPLLAEWLVLQIQVDLIAGISVGAMVVPQGMSYAKLAGLPNEYGLYGAFAPVMIYAVFGSSPQLVSFLTCFWTLPLRLCLDQDCYTAVIAWTQIATLRSLPGSTSPHCGYCLDQHRHTAMIAWIKIAKLQSLPGSRSLKCGYCLRYVCYCKSQVTVTC